ncbi:MAG TPA: electron transfer flavoprotein subunit beta/FixA family protein [Acholeplasmataceae bacterium]|jgi:electron transfer flavoprotein beta subunit|nr:electron transfer flavoprotein subunit beta/FixA family protein [Acholeplasmataceae bacterium]
MNIITCIKQVPASSEVQIDPVTGVLIRDGSNTKMNPYDLYGIETALKIKEKVGAVVKTITMGPPSAIAVLNESLWMGCDDAALLTDRKFAGADVVATSYALSQGILKLGEFDLIICGKQTTDGDTAQVGPEIAEHLGIPHLSYVDKIIEIKEKSIVVSTTMDKTVEVWEIDFPCLITVDKGIFTPRLPSYKRKRELDDFKVKVFTFKDMEDQDENNYGLKGSPTQVEKMFPPTKNTDKEMWEGKDLANRMFEKMQELKLL